MMKVSLILTICVLIYSGQGNSATHIHLSELVDAFATQILEDENLLNFIIEETTFGEKIDDENLPDTMANLTDFYFPIIESSEMGNIMGKRLKTYFERDFFAFQGIPFANEPERFEMSTLNTNRLTENPEDIYDATYLRPKCAQSSMITNGISGSEDCLHLSIYTPDTILVDKIKLTVMVFIHGGAFISGDASLYVPTKLMDKNVIVVVIQYRLGSLGFITSEDNSAPGNMGLMDQVVALQWVQKNIASFGGDAGDVTVFGQSAGAASTSWMMFTPLTNGDHNPEGALLHRIIAESGSAIEVWTLDPDPVASLQLHAEATNCTKDTPDKIIICMKGLSYEDVVRGANKVYIDDRHNGGLGFKGLCPVNQKGFDILNTSIVIAEHPLVSVATGNYLDVSMMTGSVRDEGSLVAGLVYTEFLIPKDLVNNETFMSVEFLPFMVHSFGIPDITGTVANSIRLAFLRDAEMGNWDSMVGGLIDSLGMMFLKSGCWTLSSTISIQDPSKELYVYSFEFESNDSIFEWYFISTPDIPMEGGITHADDLLYLFYLPSYMNDDERQLMTIKKMTTLWANFAKYGDPTPADVTDPIEVWNDKVEEWLPFTAVNKKFMLMQDEFTMDVDFTLRWNYNSLAEGSVNNESLHEEMKVQDEIISVDDLRQQNNNLHITTIALATTVGVLFLCLVALAFKAMKA